jgi:hypothetical protein
MKFGGEEIMIGAGESKDRSMKAAGHSTGQRAVSRSQVPMGHDLEPMYMSPCRRGLFCNELGSVCQEGYCGNCIIHESH